MAYKNLFKQLLEGAYLAKTMNGRGMIVYKLYVGNMVPLRYVNARTVKKLRDKNAIRRNKLGFLVADRKSVRSMHGKNSLKKLYKQTQRL